MKLKSLLSASLLLAALSVPASAQRKAVERREGDAFRGPVRSARIEHASYERVGGQLVEGPRRVSTVSTYTPDGKRKEQEGYAPDGTLRGKFVHVYDGAGHEIELTVTDGKGDVQTRIVRHPSAGETLVYNGDGSLRERKVVERRPDGAVVETRIYDGAGALKERTALTKEGEDSVSKTYGPDGTLKKSSRSTSGQNGLHQRVEQTHNRDGSVYGRRVSEIAPGMTEIRAVNEGYNPGAQKTRETREYDSRRNLSKVTSYVWNEATGEYEPSHVSYYTITYYR